MKTDESVLARDASDLRKLNFSESHITEVHRTVAKWFRTGLLGGFADPYMVRQAALLMENQRIFNEQWSGESGIPQNTQGVQNTEHWVQQWKRNSIPILRRLFGHTPIHNLVSFQVITEPDSKVFTWGKDGRLVPHPITARTRGLKAVWQPPAAVKIEGTGHHRFEYKGQTYQMGLDAECEAVSDFSQEIADEMTREVLVDLRNNAGSKAEYEYQGEDHLLSLIHGMAGYIGAKIGPDANWVVVAPEIVDLLGGHVEKKEDYRRDTPRVVEVGTLDKKFRLYEDGYFPVGKILVGYKDARNHYDAGYIYAPYHPVIPQQSWSMADGTHSHGQSFSRHGKKMTNPEFYGLVSVTGVPLEKETPEEEGVPSASS